MAEQPALKDLWYFLCTVFLMKCKIVFSSLDGPFPNLNLFLYFTGIVLLLYISVKLLDTLGTLSYIKFI